MFDILDLNSLCVSLSPPWKRIVHTHIHCVSVRVCVIPKLLFGIDLPKIGRKIKWEPTFLLSLCVLPRSCRFHSFPCLRLSFGFVACLFLRLIFSSHVHNNHDDDNDFAAVAATTTIMKSINWKNVIGTLETAVYNIKTASYHTNSREGRNTQRERAGVSEAKQCERSS